MKHDISLQEMEDICAGPPKLDPTDNHSPHQDLHVSFSPLCLQSAPLLLAVTEQSLRPQQRRWLWAGR